MSSKGGCILNPIEYKITLDCRRAESQVTITAKQGEASGRKITFSLNEGRLPYRVPSGVTAVLRAKKPSGAVLYNTCTVTADGNVEYTITTQTVAEVGKLPCELQLSQDGKVIFSPNFTLLVYKNLSVDSEVESSDEFTALQAAISRAESLTDGTTFTPTVSEDGVLSWTNDGGKANPDPVNIKGEDGAFRINVTYSDGKYSADKTFDEIKAAYDAGKQPYVVLTGGTLDLVYTLASFSVPDGTGHDFVDFKRYLIWEDTLETETLRIYSYTTDSGSNIENRISAFNVPSGTTYVKVSSAGSVITTVNGETYSDIKTLINAGKPVVVRYNDVLDFYYFETFGFSDSSGTHKRLNFRCDMGSIVYTLTLRDDNTWVIKETSLQSESITDKGGYFTTDTVEGALQEIGAEMALYSGSVVIEGTASDDMSEVTITTPDAWTLVSEAWNSEKRPLVVLRLSDSLYAYLTSVSTWTIDGQSTGMALFSIPPLRHLNSTPPYSIWLDESGGAAILPVESAVKSVNGQTGEVVLNADSIGAQRTLIAGSGITIIPGDDGDTIQSNTSGSVGNGLVSFVDRKDGASIAQFTLNQTQDCEINVNDLTAHLHNKFVDLETADHKLELSLSNNYRTAANQDKIDSTKLTDAPTDGKSYARKNGSWHEIAVVDVGVEEINGKTGVVTLNATEIPSTKFVPADTISFLIDGAFDEALVELTRNGASASANDFISAVNSGSTVTVSLHDQGNPKVTFEDMPVKYKITNDTLSLCFIAEAGHTYSRAIYVLSGPISGTVVSDLVENRFTDSFYQENYVSANDLPVQAPLSVEEYLEELESNVDALQPKSITDTGSYFTTDTVEGALQEIGAELADIVDGKADATDIPSLEGYATEAYVQNYHDNTKQDKITSTNKLAYSLISGTPTIPTVPTNVSTFTNDAGYLTLATLPKYEGVVE